MYSPGDRQAVPGFAAVLAEGKAHFQIGDNKNLFDWTYVGNVAYAHILAADKLVPPAKLDEEKREELLGRALPSLDRTTGKHRIPTSEARPLGPYVERPANGDALIAAFESEPDDDRPVVRSRFDPLSDSSLERDAYNSLQVAGQAFFITNGEPIYFWDFPRGLWRMLAPDVYPSRKNLVLPRTVGLVLATLSEWWGWVTGKEPTFTRFRVTFTCANRWHNIEKARRVLGYEPQVGLEDGMRRTVEVRLTSTLTIIEANMTRTVAEGGAVKVIMIKSGVCCNAPSCLHLRQYPIFVAIISYIGVNNSLAVDS